MARAAKDNGAIVSLDIDNLFDGVERLLPLVDVVLASSDLPEKLAGPLGLNEALRFVSERFGCPVVGATRGREGSILFCEGEFLETPGCDIPGGCVDTTGA